MVPADRFLSFFSEAEIEQARFKPPEPPPPPQAPLVSVPARKPSLNTRLVRYLNRKIAEMTDQR
jgi:hypothetical protein